MTAQIDVAQVRRHFAGHSDEYDLYAVVQKRVVTRLIEGLPMVFSAPVLDLGTGTGEVADHFLQIHPQSRVIVSDLAHDMTRAASSRIADCLAVDADAQSLPFKNASLGLILSASMYQWVGDLPAAFAECYRVLQPGGAFLFAMFGDGTLAELRNVFQDALTHCASQRVSHFQSFPEPGEVTAALSVSCFAQIDCRVEIEQEMHADFRQLLQGLKRIGAQNATRERPSGLFPRRVMMKMEELYSTRHQTAEGLKASYRVIYGMGIKPGATDATGCF